MPARRCSPLAVFQHRCRRQRPRRHERSRPIPPPPDNCVGIGLRGRDTPGNTDLAREKVMRFFGAIAAALMLAVGFGTGARAQVTIDVAKITCDQLILFKVADPDYIALWLSGYYHAKQNNTVIDTQELRD